MPRLTAVVRWTHVALVVVLGVRLVTLYALYTSGRDSVLHHHIESAAFLFVVGGIALRSYTSTSQDSSPRLSRPSLGMLAVFLLLAIVLYWRALGVGFLSDDFVLVARAASWNLGSVSTGLFRPVALSLWAIALSLGSGAATLHVVNVVLHGVAAYLIVWLVRGWTRDVWWSAAAGFVFLTSPIAVEAVAWCSGVFDVSMTVLVLGSVLCARNMEDDPRTVAVARFWVLAVAALLAKETAAVAPVLVLVDAWARRRFAPRLIRHAGALLVVTLGFAIFRVTHAFGVQTPPVTRYVIQRAVFSMFDSLAVPWHADLVGAHPTLAFFSVASAVALLLAFFTARRGSGLRAVSAAAVWSSVAVLPVLPFVFLAPDLQGSRYFYLPLVGWAGVVSSIGADVRIRPSLNGIALGAVAVMVGLGLYGVPVHLARWQHAADRRDVVELAARTDSRIQQCGAVALHALPDSIQGAYVFRNGVEDAFRRDLHIEVDSGARAGCIFEWDDALGAFVLVER